MIKFFRNIRKKLISIDKLLNYLQKAIRENKIQNNILCPVRDNIQVAIKIETNPRAFRYEI